MNDADPPQRVLALGPRRGQDRVLGEEARRTGRSREIASQPNMNVQPVIGITLRSPPILRMSVSPARACITAPAPRNISALKKACVTRWKMPAEYAPTPCARNM